MSLRPARDLFRTSLRRRLTAGLALTVAAGALAASGTAASSSTWDKLAKCESGQRWNINTGNGYYGGLQFSDGTWDAYGGEEFAGKAHNATREQQITVAERLLADRGWSPWPSCSRKLNLTAADARGNPFAPPGKVPPVTTAPTKPSTADAAAAALTKAEKKAGNKAQSLTRAKQDLAKAEQEHANAKADAKAAPTSTKAQAEKKAASKAAQLAEAKKEHAKAQKEHAKAAAELAAAKAAAP